MKIPFYKRASFWKTIIQAFQVGLSAVQGVTLSIEKHVEDFNIWISVAQGALAMISILTKDENNNDQVDLLEDKTETTITVESSGPVTVKDVTTEIKTEP